MKHKTKDTRWMAAVAMMAAIVVLLANTPLGLIQLPVIKATTTHIPVIIGAILLGPLAGGILGGVFGVCSLISNTIAPVATSMCFSPFLSTTGLVGAAKAVWVSVGCRILIGVVAGWLWLGLKRLRVSDLIALPNAALAIEYLRHLPAHISPVPVTREGSGYHDEALGALSSATAIRAALHRGELAQALAAVPGAPLLEQAHLSGDYHEEEALTQALLYRLRTATAQELCAVAGMEEGLEHRFLAAAKTARTRDELILAVKSKRYTYARLSRICQNILLGVTKDFVQKNAAPSYARVLGFRRDAQGLLRAIKEESSIPLVTKAADYDRADPLFALDVRAQDLWSLGCAAQPLRRSGRDFTTGPVIL